MGKIKELYIDYMRKADLLLENIVQDASGIKDLRGVKLVDECKKRGIIVTIYDTQKNIIIPEKGVIIRTKKETYLYRIKSEYEILDNCEIELKVWFEKEK